MLRERTRAGLDGLNFFVANAQTGFGPFVSVYLTSQRWTQVDIGLVLSIGTASSMASQVPGGMLVDWLRDKRVAAAAGLIGIMVAALLTAASPAQLAIAAAQVLHGCASSVVGPAIAAISLALVGLAGLGERIGRNARFLSLGNGIAAALMGVCGSFVSERAVFVLAALFILPALFALRLIPKAALRPGEPQHTGGVMTEGRGTRAPLRRCLSRGLVVFAFASFLFQLSNAAQLPLAGVVLTKEAGSWASALIAACVVVPQVVVALVSPLVGRAAERFGRREVLILGFLALPARALLFGILPGGWLVVPVQALDGVSAAVFGVMLPLVAADLTRGTGRYNLVQGIIGLTGGLGATFSTSVAGLIADQDGSALAFFGLAAVGAAAVAVLVLLMPETAPVRSRQPKPA